jgi:hypothetical protein
MMIQDYLTLLYTDLVQVQALMLYKSMLCVLYWFDWYVDLHTQKHKKNQKL